MIRSIYFPDQSRFISEKPDGGLSLRLNPKIQYKMDKAVKFSKLSINIGMNQENLPVDIEWDAEDNPNPGKPVKCKAMLTSFFERENLDTLKIDLWTKDMQIYEMDRFMYQTLRSLADTYFKATQNRELAIEMQKFVHFFGEQTEIIPKQG